MKWLDFIYMYRPLPYIYINMCFRFLTYILMFKIYAYTCFAVNFAAGASEIYNYNFIYIY